MISPNTTSSASAVNSETSFLKRVAKICVSSPGCKPIARTESMLSPTNIPRASFKPSENLP